jgi:phage shock protein PspC (stress-responsive transcriptional regulator)
MAYMDKSVEKANQTLKEFIRYSSNPWRLVWANFVAGVFRGLGAIIGASVFIAFLIWVLTLFIDAPLIGEYAKDVKDTVMGYVSDTNYNDEFERIANTLDRIEKSMEDSKKP